MLRAASLEANCTFCLSQLGQNRPRGWRVRCQDGILEFQHTLAPLAGRWAHNSAVECHLHTVEVVGSNPAVPTNSLNNLAAQRPFLPFTAHSRPVPVRTHSPWYRLANTAMRINLRPSHIEST